MGQKGSKDRLSKGDLEFLKTSTRYDENTIKEWYKGFKSDCPDGRLTPKAFMQIYSKCFPTGNANEFCDHVFRTFDTDKNGFIDFKEFLLAIDVTSSGCPEEKLNWAFRSVIVTHCYLSRNLNCERGSLLGLNFVVVVGKRSVFWPQTNNAARR